MFSEAVFVRVVEIQDFVAGFQMRGIYSILIPVPDMPMLGSSNSAANKDTMS